MPGDPPGPAFTLGRPGGRGPAGKRVLVASPSALLFILRCVAVRWLSLTCTRDARSFLDAGQDLVADFSAFVRDFTDREKGLCDLVESFTRTAHSVRVVSPP